MRIFRIVVFVLCLLSMISVGFAQELQVLKVKPFVYEKTIFIENENKQAIKAIGGLGAGMATGTATGCVVGGPIGCVIGFLGGMYAGGTAGAIAADNTAQIPKQVRVNGYMVTFNNGQTVLTTQKYQKGQKLQTNEAAYDKMI